MITVYHYTRLPDLAEVVSNKSLDGLGNAVAFLINEAMKIKQEQRPLVAMQMDLNQKKILLVAKQLWKQKFLN
ncbi:MAG: hypothetical protein EBY16_00670 [Gammaproteobacteria bacterium]|nr:hypothetical protein [Gammaproteobacteria bacterium]